MRRISRKFPGYLIGAGWKWFLDIRLRPRGYLEQGQLPVRVHKLLMADLGQQQWALKADQRGLLRVVVAGGGVLVRRVLGGALDSRVRHFSYVHTIVCPSKTIVTRRRR